MFTMMFHDLDGQAREEELNICVLDKKEFFRAFKALGLLEQYTEREPELIFWQEADLNSLGEAAFVVRVNYGRGEGFIAGVVVGQ